MGYVKEKYTKEYFLKMDSEGNPTQYGADGAELFLSGEKSIRDAEFNILKRLNFKHKCVLEFGFGRGEAIRFAKENGASIIHGVDFSETAYEIAKHYLETHAIEADLFCMDAVEYIENILSIKFDIVLMLDFVEHIPRKELSVIFTKISKHLNSRGVLVIHTPIFNADNDVIEEGLKREAADTSDLFEETKGMHCNRFTEQSLKRYMSELNYHSISNHFFICKTDYNEKNPNIQNIDWTYFCELGYPFINRNFESEVFEHAYIPEVHRERVDAMYFPIWHTIQNGLLKGRQFYIDNKDNFWQKDIVEGEIDPFYWKILSTLDLKGKTVFDIGAHIGYHSMMFAELVGEKGMVYSFEPNVYNIERMEKILDRNHDLKKRISLNNIAISDTDSYVEFNFSKQIDNGLSSGSFINGSSTPYPLDVYESIGYEKSLVKTINLNSILNYLNNEDRDPYLIKIDVEGAEYIILNSSFKFIYKYKPIFLIELHSIRNVLKIFEFFSKNNYLIEVLHFVSENYLFIYAKYQEILTSEELMGNIHKITEYSLNALNRLQTEHAKIKAEYNQLQANHTKLQTENTEIHKDHTQLHKDHYQLQADHTQLQADHTELIKNRVIRVLKKVRKLLRYPEWK